MGLSLSNVKLSSGDGTGEHPTQALLDLFTIRQFFPGFTKQRLDKVGLLRLKHREKIMRLIVFVWGEFLIWLRWMLKYHGWVDGWMDCRWMDWWMDWWLSWMDVRFCCVGYSPSRCLSSVTWSTDEQFTPSSSCLRAMTSLSSTVRQVNYRPLPSKGVAFTRHSHALGTCFTGLVFLVHFVLVEIKVGRLCLDGYAWGR